MNLHRMLAATVTITVSLAAASGCDDREGAPGDLDAAATDGGGGADSGGGGGAACATVCRRTAFDCTQPGGLTGTASLGMPTADGCSGAIAAGGEVPMLWIHCALDQICVEHVSECFPATFTSTSFTYTIPSRAPITCVAR